MSTEKNAEGIILNHTQAEFRDKFLLLFFITIFVFWIILFNTLDNLDEIAYQIDTSSYLGVALNILETGAFHSQEAGIIDLYRTPVYPVFIAGLQFIFGNSAAVIINFQLLITGIEALLIYIIARDLWDQKTGLISCVLYSLFSASWLSAATILTETLFSFFLLLSFYFFVKFHKSRQTRWLTLTSFFLGVATLTRPIGLVVYGVWVPVYFMLYYKKGKIRQHLKNTIAFLIPCGLLILCWMTRNWIVWDQFTLSTITGRNMDYYLAPAVLSQAKNISLAEARNALMETNIRGLSGLFSLFFHYPIAFILSLLSGILLILLGPRASLWGGILGISNVSFDIASNPMDLLIYNRIVELLSKSVNRNNILFYFIILLTVIFLVSIYVLSLYMLISTALKENDNRQLFIIIIVVLAMLVITPGIAGNSRFRVPIEPFLALISGSGFVSLLNARKSRMARK